MKSEINSLRQCIAELEAENVELRKENTVIPNLRNKLSLFDAEIAELKHQNAEALRANGEYNERCDTKVKKLEQKNAELEVRFMIVEQRPLQNDNASNDNTFNFNLDADQGFL